MPEDAGTPAPCPPLTPSDREPNEADRATPEQIEAARKVIQGIRLRKHYSWWGIYDASGTLAGQLFFERRWTGEPMLYHGRTAGGSVVPIRLTDKEPVLAALITEHQHRHPDESGLARDDGLVNGTGPDYGDECVIALAGGRAIRTDSAAASPEGSTYVRVCDPAGGSGYWTSDEWREAPEEVMGAFLGAAKGGRRATRIPDAARERPGAEGQADPGRWYSSMHDDEPRDQERDLSVAGRRYWASIGPDDSSKADGWSWTILEFDGHSNTVIDGGPADDEHAAKKAVDDWEAAHLAAPSAADDAAELAPLEAAFAKSAGRGVALAERIDALRARRDGESRKDEPGHASAGRGPGPGPAETANDEPGEDEEDQEAGNAAVRFQVPVTVSYDAALTDGGAAVEDFYRALAEAGEAGFFDRKLIDITY